MDATSVFSSFEEAAAGFELSQSTVGQLEKHGLNSLRTLSLVSEAEIDKEVKINIGQKLLLKELMLSLRRPRLPVGDEKEGEPRHPPPTPTSRAPAHNAEDFRGSAAAILQLWEEGAPLQAQAVQQTSASGTSSSGGKVGAYADITKFLALSNSSENVSTPLLTLVDGRISVAEKKTPLDKVSVAQYFEAALKIHQHMLTCESPVTTAAYLVYIQKVAQMAQVFTWASVLLFDREFRKAVDQKTATWDDDSPYLMSLLLRPIQQSDKAGPLKKAQSRVDPVSRKPVCIKWQRGQCSVPKCRYAHVCMVCFGAHPDRQHPGEQPEKN
jgi:hypothetical protein